LLAARAEATIHQGPSVTLPARTDPDGYRKVFYTQTTASRDAGHESQARMFARQTDRDTATTWETQLAQYDAACAWGIPDHYQRLRRSECPFSSQTATATPWSRYSHLLADLIPNARFKIYPDAAHGFVFQHHAEFSADVHRFLGD
jgi:pimeloyl-ACP methyl ester carboxylesterase